MPLDAASQQMLDAMRAVDRPPLHKVPLGEARRRAMRNLPALGRGAEMSHEEDVLIDSATPVVVRVFKPAPTTLGVVLVFHGGGWVLGNINAVTPVSRHLAHLSEMTVVAVEYRKAPEHPYPAAVDDAVKAVDWAVAHVERLTGCAGAPVTVLGESAGGNLAAAAVLRRADAVAAQVLCSPVTDHMMEYPSYHRQANQLTLTKEAMTYFWNAYAPDVARRAEPDASPLRAASLAGAPPAMVVLAEYDILPPACCTHHPRRRCRVPEGRPQADLPGARILMFSRGNPVPVIAGVDRVDRGDAEEDHPCAEEPEDESGCRGEPDRGSVECERDSIRDHPPKATPAAKSCGAEGDVRDFDVPVPTQGSGHRSGKHVQGLQSPDGSSEQL
ncbi:alpha/beta hydrolase [Sinomonas soli]